MSAHSLTYINGAYKYDFSTDSSQFYGGSAGCKPLSQDKWGMPAGDGDANGTIEVTDIINWDTEAGMKIFSPVDFNLDGQVNHKDINDFWILNLMMTCQVPE